VTQPVDGAPVTVAGDGIELTATAFGNETDPPVILLHGGGQTRHAWGSAGEALAAAGRYALSVDLRGHGDSDWAPDGDYGIGAFARDVRAVAGALPERPALVGASLGGLASLVAIGEAEAPVPVASVLVLVDVTPTVEMDGAMRIRSFMLEGMDGFERLEDAADAIAAYLPNRRRPRDLSGLRKNLRRRDGRWHWHWDPGFIRGRGGIDGQEGLVDHDRLAAAAARVSVPTLLVRGRMSDIVSEDGVQELRRLVPHAEVVDVAGAGHMVAGDRNDVFNDAVTEFLARTAPVH
jgi:non-heme chloroperoxidase